MRTVTWIIAPSLAFLLTGCNITTYDVRRPLVVDTVPKEPGSVGVFARLYGVDYKAAEDSLNAARHARRVFGVYRRDEGNAYLNVERLGEALDDMPRNPYAWIQLGAYLALTHQTEAAIDASRRGLKSISEVCGKERCPADLEGLRVVGSINLAMYCLSVDQPLQASLALDEIRPEEQAPFYALAYYWTATDTLTRLHDFGGAEQALASAAALNLTDTNSHDLQFAYEQYFQKNKRDAIQNYLQGQMDLERHHYAPARASLTKAKEFDETLWDARLALANVWFAEKQYGQTIAELRALKRDVPEHMLLRPERVDFNLGNAYFARFKAEGSMADLRSARSAYEAATEQVRERYRNARSTVRRARAIKRTEDIAAFFINALAAMQQEFGDGLNNLGLAYREESRRATDDTERVLLLAHAEEAWLRALTDLSWPDRDLAYTNLTRIYMETGRIPAAVDAAQHALAVNPSNVAAVETLVDAVKAQSNPSESARIAYAVAMLVYAHYDPATVPRLRQWLNEMAVRLEHDRGSRDVQRALLAISLARAGLKSAPNWLRAVKEFDAGSHWALASVIIGASDTSSVGRTVGELTGESDFIAELTHAIDAQIDPSDWITRREVGEALALRGRIYLEQNELSAARDDFERAVGHGVEHQSLAGAVRTLRRSLTTAALPAVRSIAVLPFTALATKQRLWPHAFSTSLARQLRASTALRVIEILPNQGSPDIIETAETARRQGTGAVLSGHLSVDQDLLLVDVLLRDALDETPLLARQYTSSTAAIPSLLNDLAYDVLQALRAPEKRVVAAAPRNGTAFLAYLEGSEELTDASRSGMRRAIDKFGAAVAADYSFAEAQAGLVFARYGLANLYEPPLEVMRLAKTDAAKALVSNRDSSDAQLAAAIVKTWYDWNFAEGEKAFSRAIALDPEGPHAYRAYGKFLLARGRVDEALQLMSCALERAPLSPEAHVDLGFAYFYRRQYSEAIEEVQRALTLNPFSGRAWAALSWIEAYSGECMSARTAIRMAIRQEGATPRLRSHEAVIEARCGQPAAAKMILQQLEDASVDQRPYVLPLLIARIYIALGNFTEARSYLQKAFDDRSESMVWLPVDPWLEPLRAAGSLRRLIDQVGR